MNPTEREEPGKQPQKPGQGGSQPQQNPPQKQPSREGQEGGGSQEEG